MYPQGDETNDKIYNSVDARGEFNMTVDQPSSSAMEEDQPPSSQVHLENENGERVSIRNQKVAYLSLQPNEANNGNPFMEEDQPPSSQIHLENENGERVSIHGNPFMDNPFSESSFCVSPSKVQTPKFPCLSSQGPKTQGAWSAVKDALSPTVKESFMFPRQEASTSFNIKPMSTRNPTTPAPIFTPKPRANASFSSLSTMALGSTCNTEIDLTSGTVVSNKGTVASNKEFKFYSPNVQPKKQEDEGEERGHWGSRMEFVLSCVGYSVGLGNVWRFPFLAYENGGGAFLIPYVVLLVLVGKPMYFMEAALGQYSQVGPLAVWMDMCRAGMGVGVAMVIISLMVAIYYNVIMAYTLVYLFNCFRSVLPWSTCDPAWGADSRCFVRDGNGTSYDDLQGTCILDEFGSCVEERMQSSAEQFWEKGALDIRHSGLETFGDIGEIKWNLAFCLLLSWLTVNVCLIKGVKTSGKVVYFTATFPYVVLLILLVRGCTLPGAGNGLYYLFVPKWSKLADMNVWRAAASQVFFSLGISWGGIILFGSYNKFDARVHIDSHIVSLVDFLTSLIASIVIFSTLGNTAYELGVPIETVAKGGPGLAFVAFPEALSKLPCPHFWSIIFFSMLFLLGLDSEFALFETALSAIFDAVPKLRKQKMLVTSLMSAVCFLLGLPCISQCGQYILNLMDTYGAGLSVLIIAIFEMIFINWVYGTREFCKDINTMLGFTPGLYFRLCWSLISPFLLVGILLAGCWSWEVPSYGPVEYPPWAHRIGWILALVSIGQIPFWAIVVLIESACTTGWKTAFTPSKAWKKKRDAAHMNDESTMSKTSFDTSRQPVDDQKQCKYFPNFKNPFLSVVDGTMIVNDYERNYDGSIHVNDSEHNHGNNNRSPRLDSEYGRLQKNLATNSKIIVR